MKKKDLQEYKAKERKEFDLFKRKIQFQGLAPHDRYPSLERLEIFHQPIVYSVGTTYRFDKQKIWSQIPLAGTLLIPLSAYDKDRLLNGCGFEVSDIPDLIRLAKEGHVRFGLADRPELFENLDHFDPIFTELNPPELLYLPDEALSTDPQTINNFRKEFEDTAKVNYYDSLVRAIKNEGLSQNHFLSMVHHRMDTFVYMKILDIQEVDNISKLMKTEPPHADTLLAAYEYLVEPIFGPLKAYKNYSLSEIQQYDLNSLRSKIPYPRTPNLRSFPTEIARFIMKKVAFNPSSYDDCIKVIDHYEQNGLYKVYDALETEIKTKKQEKVSTHISEVDEIMENSWKDANKIGRRRESVQFGISVLIGGVGILARAAMGLDPSSASGILASVGISASEKGLNKYEKLFADKITRFFYNKYLVTIYDFKQKYNLK